MLQAVLRAVPGVCFTSIYCLNLRYVVRPYFCFTMYFIQKRKGKVNSETPTTSWHLHSAYPQGQYDDMNKVQAHRDAATATQRLTRFDKTSPQVAVVSRYSPLPHPRLPPHRPPIFRHNFSRERVPDIWAAAVPPQPTSNPPTPSHQPPQSPPASPDQHSRRSRTSPAGHLDTSESCVPRAQCQIKLLYWHLSSKKTSGKEQW